MDCQICEWQVVSECLSRGVASALSDPISLPLRWKPSCDTYSSCRLLKGALGQLYSRNLSEVRDVKEQRGVVLAQSPRT